MKPRKIYRVELTRVEIRNLQLAACYASVMFDHIPLVKQLSDLAELRSWLALKRAARKLDAALPPR